MVSLTACDFLGSTSTQKARYAHISPSRRTFFGLSKLVLADSESRVPGLGVALFVRPPIFRVIIIKSVQTYRDCKGADQDHYG